MKCTMPCTFLCGIAKTPGQPYFHISFIHAYGLIQANRAVKENKVMKQHSLSRNVLIIGYFFSPFYSVIIVPAVQLAEIFLQALLLIFEPFSLEKENKNLMQKKPVAVPKAQNHNSAIVLISPDIVDQQK
eukprot:c7205_g1_i1 orf=116-505(-)